METKKGLKRAVALKYDKEKTPVPRVIAKGSGLVADNILSIASQNLVPVYQNQALTSMLMAVELDREIPPELYKVVAEIMAFIYRLDQQRKPYSQPPSF